jgi:nitroreductase
MTEAAQTAAAIGTENTDDAAQLDRLLRARYSCRAFLPDPVPEPVIARILEMAQRTASWCNSQPWHTIVTSGDATERFRQAMYEHATTGGDGASDLPQPRESGFQLYNTLGIPRGDRAGYQRQAMENFRLFGAPHVAIITTEEALDVYGAVDCGGFVSTFLLAAQAMGVATVAQAALARYAPFVRRHFEIPDDRLLVCGISFGYGDHDHLVNSYRTSRAPLTETVRWMR